MANLKVQTDMVYNINENTIHTVIRDGEVLVYDCSTNPCQPQHRIIPDRSCTQVTCLALLYLNNYFNKEDGSVDALVFGGQKDGRIVLMESNQFIMPKKMQAHQGATCLLETSDGLRRAGVP